jgi:glutamate-1-semialdehyde aminotransferase
VAKGEYLSLKCSPAPEERRECGEDGQKGTRHREFSLTHRAEKFNDYAADGIFGRHNGVYMPDLHTVFTSAVHTEEDGDRIVEAFKNSLRDMREDGLF